MILRADLEPVVRPERLHHFIRFLNDHGRLEGDRLPDLLKSHSNADSRIGQICFRNGWLDHSRIHDLLTIQAERDLSFGEAGIEAGLLTRRQVSEVLKLQSNRFLLFLDSLVSLRIVVEDQIEMLLEEYRDHLETHGEPADSEQTPPSSHRAPSPQAVRACLQKVRSLGSLPAVVQKLLVQTQDPECGSEQLTETLSLDPNLAAQLLRIVNSAFVAPARKISSLQQAVLRIGSAGVRVIALAAVAVERFRGGHKDRRHKIWRHSVLCSQWSRALAEEAEVKLVEEAFVAGLVHDIGRAVIEQQLPAAAVEIERLTFLGRTLEEAEREKLSQTHADIGAYLADLWKFPAPIVEAIACHHAPFRNTQGSKERPTLVAIVRNACFLSSQPFQPYNEEANRKLIDGFPPELREQHGLDERLLKLVPGIYEHAAELAAWLQ